MSAPGLASNPRIAAVGCALLFIGLRISILIGPITIGMCGVGTGPILLGVRAVRYSKSVFTSDSTISVGIIAVAWGRA